MRNRLVACAIATLGLFTAVATAGPGQAAQADAGPVLVPQAVQAPDAPGKPGAAGDACTAPTPDPSGTVTTYAWIHCYTPAQIAAAYGVDALHAAGNLGAGQTIVLLDAYGSPTARQDLQKFHDTFFPALPSPDFDVVYPQGPPDFQNGCHGNGTGLSGPCAAAGWSGEATLDIEWAYAIAPRAHIVLIGVPPAETEGVQGFPNLFKALQQAIDTYPAGTVSRRASGSPSRPSAGPPRSRPPGSTLSTGRPPPRATRCWPPLVTTARRVRPSNTARPRPTRSPRSAGPPPARMSPRSAARSCSTAGPGSRPATCRSWPTVTTTRPTSPSPAAATQSRRGTRPGRRRHRRRPQRHLPAACLAGPAGPDHRPRRPRHAGPFMERSSQRRGAGVDHRLSRLPAVRLACLRRNQRGVPAGGRADRAGQRTAGRGGPAAARFLNPLLYRVGDQPGAATAAFGGGGSFRDIVPHTYGTAASGVLADNRLWQYNADGSVSPGPVPGWPTLPGWDMTTGFGSPRAAAFVAAIRAARNSP